VFTYGQAGDIPIVGDWTNTGVQRIGIFRSGQWWLDVNNDHTWTQAQDAVFTLGEGGDRPVIGNWSGSGQPALVCFAAASGGFRRVVTINGSTVGI
jgi:hypothetical protein